MGSKFYSVHILNSSLDEVAVYLANCQLFNTQRDTITAISRLGGHGWKNIIPEIIKGRTATFKLLTNLKDYNTASCGINVTVVSDYFSSGISKDDIKKWFCGIKTYVLMVNYMDDDVLSINVFHKYNFLQPLVIGTTEQYGMQLSHFDNNDITSIFNISTEEVEKCYSMCPEHAIEYLSKLFKLPLMINYNSDIDSNYKVDITTYNL